METWQRELSGDPDASFLLDGVENGFQLVSRFDFKSVEMDNYNSALDSCNRDLVEEQINIELLEGRYEIVSEKPTIVSAIGAIRKPSGKVRIIHDASRPIGAALNTYADIESSQSFQTLSDACDLLSHGAFLVKIDLKSAYRSVGVCSSCFPATGLKWKFKGDTHVTYMIDKCLPFGAKFSPGIFHRLTQAVRRMMLKRGYSVVVYLDDFLIIESSYSRCLEAQKVLIALLRELGFAIAWEKVEGPTQSLTFLGIEIDTVRDLLVLPEKKLKEFETLVSEVLMCQRISLKKLQSLAGKLNWASSVVRGGRTYLRRILDMMKPLRLSHHKLKISKEMRKDLIWWKKFLRSFNGKKILSYSTVSHFVYVDACDTGGACFYNGDWQYVNWKADYPEMLSAHINVKEAMMVCVAAQRWSMLWAGDDVIVRCDNRAAASAFNKYTSRSVSIMYLVREVLSLSMTWDFSLKCWYLPGVCNILADALSRLDELEKISTAAFWLEWDNLGFQTFWQFELILHMSFDALLSIAPQMIKWSSSGSAGEMRCWN